MTMRSKAWISTSALALLFLLSTTPTAAQQAEVAAAKEAAMDRIAFLAGEWEGEGWMRAGERSGSFRGTESVTPLLGGRVLVIEGRHHEPESGEQVHHAVAVVTYDAEAGHYWFRSEVDGAGGVDATGEMVDDAFVWTMTTPWGTMRYTIRLNEAGEWHEIGEMTRDGDNWVQHFEMTMRRVGDS